MPRKKSANTKDNTVSLRSVSSKSDDLMSLAQACDFLAITEATGRNWLKLGKLVKAPVEGRGTFFDRAYIEKIKQDLLSGDDTVLKSRRNKKYISGNRVYESYVSSKSINLSSVQALIDLIDQKQIKVTNELILTLVADCAVKLILSKEKQHPNHVSLLKFLKGAYRSNRFIYLVDDLVFEYLFIDNMAQLYNDLFCFDFVFEDSEDVLGLLYISLKSIGKRKAEGTYYTPTRVVKKLLSNITEHSDYKGKSFIDPCCGSGNFILQLPCNIGYQHVYGADIDKLSVRLARINYALKYDIDDKNIVYEHIFDWDFLLNQRKLNFDYIIGNPPWGYEFSSSQQEVMRHTFKSASGKYIESYDLFLENALRYITKEGAVSFVLPEAILNVKAHSLIRQLIINSSKIDFIEYLGDAFEGVECPCIIMQISLSEDSFDGVGLRVKNTKNEYVISKPREVNADVFSFTTTDEEYQVLQKISSHDKRCYLKDHADFALGIVTGNNKLYISSQKSASNETVLRGSDIYRYRFSPKESYIDFKPHSFQQVAPVSMYRAEEKLLYRFICSQLVFAYDNQKTLSLNSCNILIPHLEGMSTRYILAVLNSSVAQFFFKKQFNSVKVLRSHIEAIPIPAATLSEQQEIESLADMLIEGRTDEPLKLYEMLDERIFALYSLDEQDTKIIRDSLSKDSRFLLGEA